MVALTPFRHDGRAASSRGYAVAAAAVVLGLAVGAGLFLVPHALRSSSRYPFLVDRHQAVARFPTGVGGADANAGVFPTVAAHPFEAATPGAAVEHFLAARVAGHLDDAWRSVSDADHREFPDASDWVAANGDLPVVRAYTLATASVTGDRAELHGTVDEVPALDAVRGEVPARLNATWVTRREHGSWRLSLIDSAFTPVYPADALAPPAALSWARALQRQHCATSQSLIGDAPNALVQQLCSSRAANDAVRVGSARELDDNSDAEPFIAAYGADVFTWVRVVPVTAPTPLDLVLAPIGDQWSVIGAVQASPSSSQ